MKILQFFFTLCVLTFFNHPVITAQYTLRGTVRNDAGEKLTAALIYLDNTNFAAVSDDHGRYEIRNIPAGNYLIKISYVGYRTLLQPVTIHGNTALDFVLSGTMYNLENIEIRASRVHTGQPFTHKNLTKEDIRKENLGVDMPYLLQWTPSITVTSDAGNGIGYTGMRIRGTDQTRINVTINGVPLNDAESQDVFWVDLPDLGSSVQSVQIQRGVGPSANGPGAFGGTVGIQTHQTHINPYAEAEAAAGSFDARKFRLSLGTGLINDRYSIDGRFSRVTSDGYMDRASADLTSWYLSGARVTEKSSLRLNVFSGKEITYQAWHGVPEARLRGSLEGLQTHYFNNVGTLYKNLEDSLNLFNSGRRYNYYLYPNQVDNYTQTHAQLHYSRLISGQLKWNAILYYTKGQGFFEQFRYNDRFSDYGLENIRDNDDNPLESSNIIRRRWLDNDLVGGVADLHYSPSKKYTLQWGMAANTYMGDHFGNIVFAEGAVIPDPAYRYYDNNGHKSDLSSYIRQEFQAGDRVRLFADLQYRFIHYTIKGIDQDLQTVDLTRKFHFFNPKLGTHYRLSDRSSMYLSWSVGQREPARADFLDNAAGRIPDAEYLSDWEAGYSHRSADWVLDANLYYMRYRNQLVLTGDLNDVGAAIRTNVPVSYRLGIELDGKLRLHEKWFVSGNLNLSRNKIRDFEEIIFDYTNGYERIAILHDNTDIAFSPTVNTSLQLMFIPVKGLEAELSTRYVGRQFLDNTSSLRRSIAPYHFQNVRLGWQFTLLGANARATLMVNNVLDRLYETNGYTYSYIFGELITENFYYPQAGRNWMLGLLIRI